MRGGAADYFVADIERDALGRALKSSVPTLESGSSYVAPVFAGQLVDEVEYVGDGRTVRSWRTGQATGQPDEWSESTWDVLSTPHGLRIATTSKGRSGTGGFVENIAYANARGWRTRLFDAVLSETEFQLDPLGRVEAVVDDQLNSYGRVFDSWGRLEELQDPDLSLCPGGPQACPWTFEYDLVGRMQSRTDALGQTVHFAYDEAGRLVARTGGCEGYDAGGNPIVGAQCNPSTHPGQGTALFFHDGWQPNLPGPAPVHAAGTVSFASGPMSETYYEVDHWGRNLSTVRRMQGQEFESNLELLTDGSVLTHEVGHHDAATSVSTVFDPLVYEYDLSGYLKRLTDDSTGFAWIESVDRHPEWGTLEQLNVLPGGLLQQAFGYGTDARLRSLHTSIGGATLPPGATGVLQSLSLDYDEAGRVESLENHALPSGGTALAEFGYDALGRLTSVSGASAGYARSYAYDSIGNMVSNSFQADSFGSGTMEYGDQSATPGVIDGGPHATTSVGASGAPHEVLQYNGNGAVEFRERMSWAGASGVGFEREYGYRADGRLNMWRETKTGASTDQTDVFMGFDAFGNRVFRETIKNGAVTESLYTPVPGMEVRNGTPVKRVRLGSSLYAETEETVIVPTSRFEVIAQDHLGRDQARAKIEWATGTPLVGSISQVRLDPYGVELDGNAQDWEFGSGGGRIEATGETFLGWRMMDPELGRFVQPDVLSSAHAMAGQGLNRFRFGWNSPTNYSDPSGFWEESLGLSTIGSSQSLGGLSWAFPAGISADGDGPYWSNVAGVWVVIGSAQATFKEGEPVDPAECPCVYSDLVGIDEIEPVEDESPEPASDFFVETGYWSGRQVVYVDADGEPSSPAQRLTDNLEALDEWLGDVRGDYVPEPDPRLRFLDEAAYKAQLEASFAQYLPKPGFSLDNLAFVPGGGPTAAGARVVGGRLTQVSFSAGGPAFRAGWNSLWKGVQQLWRTRFGPVRWTSHGGKHVAGRNVPWGRVVKSTKSGPAKYKPGTAVEQLERGVWETGFETTNGRPWRVAEFATDIGASGGKASRWVRVEFSAGTIHGHPITKAEYRKLLK